MLRELKTNVRERYPRVWYALRTTNNLRRLVPRVYGYAERRCPICDYRGKFFAEIHFPDIFTYDAVCPSCGSMPRNRLLKFATEQRRLLDPSARVLHFAPEAPVRRFVEPAVASYRTADIDGQGVDLTIDIERIDLADASCDLIICSHVLEHVDHVKALSELFRVLAPGGTLLALFPIVEAWPQNYENPDVVTTRDRGLHFGKDNHVRRFGSSVRGDFTAAGFVLEDFSPIGPQVIELGLIPGENLFIATKPS